MLVLSSSSGSSSFRSSPIVPSTSVKLSMTAIGGSGNLTLSIKLLTTFSAQVIKPATSFARSATADSKLLSAIMALIFFSDTTFLLFKFEQSDFGSGLTSRALNRATTSSLDFSRLSMYWDFNLASVIHCLLALSVKNRSAKRKASCVASAGAMVVVGTRKNGQFAVVGPLVDALHEPDQVIEAGVSDVEVLLVVGNGNTPDPGVPDDKDLLVAEAFVDVGDLDESDWDEDRLEDIAALLVLVSLLEDDLLVWLWFWLVPVELEVFPVSLVLSLLVLDAFPDVIETVELVELVDMDDMDPVVKDMLEDDRLDLEVMEEIVAFLEGVLEEDVLMKVDSELLLVREIDREVDILVPIIMPVPVAKGMELLPPSIEALGWNLRERS